MAERPKGNLLLEMMIVVLTIALLITILYPKKIWQKEDQLQNVCHTRMEAIQQAEFQYMSLANTYEDTLDTLMRVVRNDENALLMLDTTINWDGIVNKSELKQLIMGASMPGDLRQLIISKVESGMPLGRLAKWDSLEYQMLDQLKGVLALADSSAGIDTLVDWRMLVGEMGFWNVYEACEMPRNLKTNTRKDLRKEVPVQETRAWKYLRESFVDTLSDIILLAETPDVWTTENKEAWEKIARKNWEAEMDRMSEAEIDSIWQLNQKEFWDKNEEVIWKQDKKALWKQEGETWLEENALTWGRIIETKWEQETKKAWVAAHTEDKPDSVIAAFEATRDSLWRTQIDSIRDTDFEAWKSKEKKYVEGEIDGLWSRERRETWRPMAINKWLDEKQAEFDAFWVELKEGIWNNQRYDLWEIEEKKLASKQNALSRLDKTVKWHEIIGDEIQGMVNGLNLPDNQELWKKINSFDLKKGSALVNYGIAPLFRDVLLDSIPTCPEAGIPYIIDVEDSTVLKKFSVSCPIKEQEYEKYVFGFSAPIVLYYQGDQFKKIGMQFPLTRKVGAKRSYIEKMNAETGETEIVFLHPGIIEKIFGARSIVSHGYIDKDGKKSWIKKS